jgi:hypothetical protein
MKLELRDDITRKDIGYFILLILFIVFWTWVVFWSGLII